MNAKIVLLVVGMIVGAVAGWLLQPLDPAPLEAIDLTALGFDLPVAPAPDPQSFDWERLAAAAAAAIIGGGSGLAFGFLIDRDRRRKRHAVAVGSRR